MTPSELSSALLSYVEMNDLCLMMQFNNILILNVE